MESIKKAIRVSKSDEDVHNELVGSYGNSLVLMSSNPEVIDQACKKLGSEYSVLMDTTLMENRDYAKVIIRK